MLQKTNACVANVSYNTRYVYMMRITPCLIHRMVQCIRIEHMSADSVAGAYVYKYVYKNIAYVFWLCRQRGANIQRFFFFMLRTSIRISRTEI